ncbi:MAG: hypothetical protein A2428_08935 [Bdellovibrionales bacterium RIFOXYC1_FULL_54_43]|nr:MAG: hypothetical protein A2428_08935 [Bdellovibrionales bacterium RIFOXYC1_FULL_54_43]
MTEPTATKHLTDLIAAWLQPLGYDLVHLEAQTHRERVLRLFIDFPEDSEAAKSGKRIGVEDCVKVSRALDEPLENNPEVNRVFHEAAYELEVSSPGLERPLRKARDYERFQGTEARLHVFRPLTAEELENPEYCARNPKQKNFLGVLMGLKNDKVRLGVPSGTAEQGKNRRPKKESSKTGRKPGPELSTNSVEEIFIPLPLISKANLEPRFELDSTPRASDSIGSEERENEL